MRRRLGVLCVLVAAVLGAVAAPALALPGDPPVELLAPAQGASLPTDAAGITVSYTCPLYRTQDFGGGNVRQAGEENYTVLLSPSPQLDGEGRLADVVARGTGTSTPEAPNTCTVQLSSSATTPAPQETPGTWYWQVSRLCAMCSPPFETSEVRSFTLVTSARPTLSLPARIYAGHPFIARVTMPGAPTGTAVALQRAAGPGWRTIGSDDTAQGTAVISASVARAGRTTVRARLEIGGQVVEGTGVAVRVRPTRGAPVTAVRAGRWSGGGGVTFRVSGRTIRGFGAQVPLLCPTPGMVNQFTTQIAKAAITSIRLAPDGSFVGASTAGGAAVRAYGRLRGGSLSGGHVEMSLGGCVGSADLSAARG